MWGPPFRSIRARDAPGGGPPGPPGRRAAEAAGASAVHRDRDGRGRPMGSAAFTLSTEMPSLSASFCANSLRLAACSFSFAARTLRSAARTSEASLSSPFARAVTSCLRESLGAARPTLRAGRLERRAQLGLAHAELVRQVVERGRAAAILLRVRQGGAHLRCLDAQLLGQSGREAPVPGTPRVPGRSGRALSSTSCTLASDTPSSLARAAARSPPRLPFAGRSPRRSSSAALQLGLGHAQRLREAAQVASAGAAAVVRR